MSLPWAIHDFLMVHHRLPSKGVWLQAPYSFYLYMILKGFYPYWSWTRIRFEWAASESLLKEMDRPYEQVRRMLGLAPEGGQ